MRDKAPEKDRGSERTKKRMIAVVIAGLLLIAADLAVSLSSGGVVITREKGELYMIRPGPGDPAAHATLRASVSGEGADFDRRVSVSLAPYSEEVQKEDEIRPMSAREQAEYELRTVTGEFNSDLTQTRVKLPQELRSGAGVRWTRERSSNTVMLSMLTMVTALAVYRKRFGDIRREERRRQESVMRQLPEFVNRLVLLLDAGLVLNTAFEKSVEECLAFRGQGDDYFYSSMSRIYETARNTNGSMNAGFREFAKESGIRELLRLSNIIEDNIHKGAALNEKLEAESENLWIARKKSCEERGRLAETKMTLPLVMFLMALIMITVAPAMIEL